MRIMCLHMPDFEHDRAESGCPTLEQLACWALRFSPTVQPVEPAALLVDISGCRRLFRGEPNIARQALGGLLRRGLSARAGVADTVGAAWAVALGGSQAMAIVPPGQACAYLADLPAWSLRLEPRVCQRLDQLGLRTIGDLLMLPRSSLPARFGQQTVLRIRQALGEVPEPLVAFSPEIAPAVQAEFETALTDGPTLLFVLGRLLDELFAKIESAELALCVLACVVVYEESPPVELTVALSRASRAWKHVAELVRQRWEQFALQGPVAGLRLVARETVRWRGQQADLFDPCDPGLDEAFGCLVDRLANRLGAGAVVRAVLRDDYQPEAAFAYVPLAEMGEDKLANRSGAGSASGRRTRTGESMNVGRDARPTLAAQDARPAPVGRDARPALGRREGANAAGDVGKRGVLAACVRPLCLLPEPEPVRAIALVPDGPPTWLAIRGRGYAVACSWGPERIETGWWRGPDVRRDYFRLATEDGRQLWVFHEPDTPRWFLHGVFC